MTDRPRRLRSPIVPIYITENGVAKVRAADVLKTAEARRQIAAIGRLRAAASLGMGDGG